jgi:hypothetical protein
VPELDPDIEDDLLDDALELTDDEPKLQLPL